MSIQPAKFSNEDHSSTLGKESAGYVERSVRWIARKILHLKISSTEQLESEELIDKINKKMLCPTVLFRQFERHVLPSQRIQCFESLGQTRPFSYTERVWNWVFADQARIKRRHREIGKFLALKNPYLLSPVLIKALSNPDDWQTCQCSEK